jgi:hypothetical protein
VEPRAVNFPRYTLTARPNGRSTKEELARRGLITVGALLAARVFGAFGFGDNPARTTPAELIRPYEASLAARMASARFSS